MKTIFLIITLFIFCQIIPAKQINYGIALKFCEGHLQRGMNVSWHLKQYSPNWEQQNEKQILYASNTNFKYQGNNDITVKISNSNPEIIQGKSIDICVKIENNTNNIIRLSTPKQFLYDILRDSLITSKYGHGVIDIAPHSTYYNLINPLHYIAHNGNSIVPGYPWFYWYTGDYDYYISYFLGKNKFVSNRIRLKINPVPDSLDISFNKLKDHVGEKTLTATNEELFQKSKYTFYEKEYFYKLLRNHDYWAAIQNKKNVQHYREMAKKLFKEFIIKYPNSADAYNLFKIVMYNFNDNKSLIEDILKTLIKDKPNCKLLEVLRNQPDYLNKQIKYLLK